MHPRAAKSSLAQASLRALRAVVAASAIGVGGAYALAAPAGATQNAVALLATPPGATQTSLHLAPLAGGPVGPALATLTHLPDAVVRGAVLPGTSIVLATADTSPSRDASFNASLFRLEPSREPAVLCDRVVHASRPLVTATGRVFVSRGVAGPEPEPTPQGSTRLRSDTLTVDEVDPKTGATRTVLTHKGYLAFLAGAWKNELVIYRISASRADLVAVDADSGSERELAPSILPFARDFSIDAATGALIFEERHEADSGTWVIDRIQLSTGKRYRIASSASIGLAPHAWPGGGVAYTPDRKTGLELLNAQVAVHGPLGPGIDAIQAISADGAWVAALHMNPDAFAVPFAIRTKSGAASRLDAPSGARIDIAGFVAAKAVGAR